ncbi:MAG: ATP-binding cassette domain-containing protein [Lentisphaeria bacterium]|nr:ATP-binding cassette domain-containing protein [Lentisphaeria bacterium]
MIELCDVAVSYAGLPVLARVSLVVPVGGMICLLGDSGCGKTTVLNVVAGLVRPDRGTVRVEARRPGYVFQKDRLIPWRSVRQNVVLALLRDVDDLEEASRRADEWLERLGLSDAADRCPGELSGGMRRRVNLARAFAVEPDLLLLDEPFAFLDDSMVGVVRDEILRIRRERPVTLLAVSHVRAHIEPLSPEIIEIFETPVTINHPRDKGETKHDSAHCD